MPYRAHTAAKSCFVALLFCAFSANAQTAPAAPPAIQFAPANLSPLGVRALAANCAACHGQNGIGVSGAVPALAGLNAGYFVKQMELFRAGKREATLMHQVSKGYSEAETAALAEYFSKQKKM